VNNYGDPVPLRLESSTNYSNISIFPQTLALGLKEAHVPFPSSS